MKFIAEIDVMPQKEILDPQGKAVRLGLHNLHIDNVGDVRIGKHIRLEVQAENEEAAKTTIDAACRQLLANLIMEEYSFTLHAV